MVERNENESASENENAAGEKKFVFVVACWCQWRDLSVVTPGRIMSAILRLDHEQLTAKDVGQIEAVFASQFKQHTPPPIDRRGALYVGATAMANFVSVTRLADLEPSPSSPLPEYFDAR